MSRLPTYLIGPETILLVFNLAVFRFCATHNSGEGNDLRLMEQCVWILPPLAVAAAFLTVLVPGSLEWSWWARAIVASLVGAAVATWRVVEGFGTGAKGQDAAFVIALCLAGVAMGIGSAVTGAMILADKRPEFAAWLRARPVLGSVLTLAVAAPLGLGIVVIAMFTLGFLASLVGALRK